MTEPPEPSPYAEGFTAALLDRDMGALERLTAELERAGMTVAEIYSDVFAPALESIGELWAAGEISIAQEHIASSLVEGLMARLYPRVFVAPRASRQPIVMSCVEGERHVLGLRMAADLLEGAGFEIVFLGADNPIPVVLEAIALTGPAVVVLTAKLDQSIAPLARAIEAVEESASAGAAVVVGGVDSMRERISPRPEVLVLDRLKQVVPEVERVLA